MSKESIWWGIPDHCSHYADVAHYRKVINGKKYDTSTAEQLMLEMPIIDGRLVAVLLFRKRTGEYFSYTIEYSIWNRNNVYLVDGAYIKPLTEDEAKGLVEKYADGYLYEDIFGEVDE